MWVVKLGGSFEQAAPASGDAPSLTGWLSMLAEAGAGRVVIVPGGGRFAQAVRDSQARWGFDDLAAHNMAVLAMAQTAHLLCSLEPRLARCEREADLAGALRAGLCAVWSPIELQRDQADADTSWEVTSDSIALALAVRQQAQRLVVVKSCAVDPRASPHDLVAAGIVDRRFAALVGDAAMPIDVVGPSRFAAIRDALLRRP